jgi:hypothetical protein
LFPHRGNPREREVFNEADPSQVQSINTSFHSLKLSPNVIEIASNASSVFDKSCYTKQAKALHEGTILQPLPIGINQRPPMKKEATPECNGLKSKNSNEKRGNSKMQGA